MFDQESQVDSSWLGLLAGQRDNLRQLGDFLHQENISGQSFLPAESQILRAFTTPLDQVRVVILGQDPYPTPGHAMGLAFSVAPGVAAPRSLINIFKELESDIGCPPPQSGDLTSWIDQGVLLLNQVLTVRSGMSASHRGKGWEEFTHTAIKELVAHSELPPVFILWGKDAQRCVPIIGDSPVITSSHPSPLSAHRGFFNSRPFSRANTILTDRGQNPINWCLAG